MHLYANDDTTQQQRKAATIEVARKRYLAAKRQGKVNVSLSAEEAQKRAQKSVFRLS
ncbi:MAG: hypothetical protein HLUCCA13_15045 [Halomonas sp. HL-48]|nr:hypothetical protein [Halomonas sp. HL-48]KPQ23188.1 MAG: hypothetical protein HLUCCA13_15045 [Halomonas sp. HL-48]